MTTDNRTELDACDAVGTWTGDTTPALNTDVKYQNTGCMQVQATNTFREWYCTVAKVLTNCTIYFLVKAGNPDTKANGGIRAVIGGATNRRAYYVGGNDDPGLPLKGGWACYRLDTANLPASYSQQKGSGVPDFGAITEIGVGILQPSKATGNSPNTFFDRISYIANGSPAFRVNGGTSGTPITFAQLVTDDETNGWGFFNNPIAGSKLYCVYGAIRWGDDAALSYFADSNCQIYFRGIGLSSGTMNQTLLGYGSGTNSLVLTNCTIVALGAVPNWTLNVANHNIFKITNCQFVGHGTFLCPTVDASNKWVTGTTFDTCGKITVSTLTFTYNTVRNCTSDALLISSTAHGLLYNSFTSNVRAIQFDTPETYGLTGDQFASNTYDIHFSSATGNLIINAGGSPKANPSSGKVLNDSTGTVTINNTVNMTVTVRDAGTDALISGALVMLRASSAAGDYPYQVGVSIVSTGTLATVTHTTHGLQTDEYVQISGANESYYNGIFQITVTGVSEYQYTMLGDPADTATGSPVCTFVLLIDTTVSGVVTDIMRYKTLDQPFTGRVRKSSGTPLYKQGILSGSIENADYATTVYLVGDE